MYLTDIRSNLGAAGESKTGFLRSAGGRNVLAFGFVSLFTDISSEMVVAVLPLFLTTSLGFGILGFAAFEGFYQTASAAFRLAGGRVADRSADPKKISAWGYGLSTLTRAGLFLSTFVGQTLALPFLLLDRVGKGIRVAPRDTIISRSVDDTKLATAFGVHRTLDTTGALLGPIAAFAILALTPKAFDSVFLVSTMAGIIGFSILILVVKNPKEVTQKDSSSTEEEQVSLWQAINQPLVLRLALLSGVLAVTTIGDPLIYLYIFETADMDPAWFPLLYAGTAITFVLTAVPIGIISDRVGFVKVFLFGQILLAPLYLWLSGSQLGSVSILCVLGILGIYYACTDGVLAALGSAISKPNNRGTTLGAISMCIALAKFASALVFGFAWSQTQNPEVVLRWYAAAVVIATIVGAIGLKNLLTHRAGAEELADVS